MDSDVIYADNNLTDYGQISTVADEIIISELRTEIAV